MTDDERVPNVSPDVLNATELRVAKLLTAGCSLSEIADRIHSDLHMVRSHRDAILEKLGASDQAILIRWASLFDVARW